MAGTGTGWTAKGGATLDRRFEGERLFLEQAATRGWKHLAGIHTPDSTDHGPKEYPALSVPLACNPQMVGLACRNPLVGRGPEEPGWGLRRA